MPKCPPRIIMRCKKISLDKDLETLHSIGCIFLDMLFLNDIINIKDDDLNVNSLEEDLHSLLKSIKIELNLII